MADRVTRDRLLRLAATAGVLSEADEAALAAVRKKAAEMSASPVFDQLHALVEVKDAIEALLKKGASLGEVLRQLRGVPVLAGLQRYRLKCFLVDMGLWQIVKNQRELGVRRPAESFIRRGGSAGSVELLEEDEARMVARPSERVGDAAPAAGSADVARSGPLVMPGPAGVARSEGDGMRARLSTTATPGASVAAPPQPVDQKLMDRPVLPIASRPFGIGGRFDDGFGSALKRRS